MLTYLLPTHDRPERLRQTLDAIGSLDLHAHQTIGGAEVVVIDNASTSPAVIPLTLHNGIPARAIRLERNIGAAARNVGVAQASGKWIIMLDDDSYPLNEGHVDVLVGADADVAAIGAEIVLPDGSREAGGLPEVFVGCGVAVRKDAFMDAGGYDPSFDYYAEEYDLSAKLILNGWRIGHDRRFQVRHDKVARGRDRNRIVGRLVRNNVWVMQRYAPERQRNRQSAEIVNRYARIALKEQASRGFAQGMAELAYSLDHQPVREMTDEQFDRFTGLSHVRKTLSSHAQLFSEALAVVDEGKNSWAVHQALRERGARIVSDPACADSLVVGTLSPGPMLDALDRWQWLGRDATAPWQPCGTAPAFA